MPMSVLIVKTSDDHVVEVSENMLRNCLLFKSMLECTQTNQSGKILVSKEIFDIIKSFANLDGPSQKDEVKDKNFCSLHDDPTITYSDEQIITIHEEKQKKILSSLCIEKLTILIGSANYLNYSKLLEMGCSIMAERMNGNGDEEMWI